MEKTLNLAPNKHMLQLNFDEDSSDDEDQNRGKKDQKSKFQKVYDLDFDYVNLKRDKFTVNKVQKGLFVNEVENFQYETYQVEQKPKKEKKYTSDEVNQQQTSKAKLQDQDFSSNAKNLNILNNKTQSLQFMQKSSSDEQGSKVDEQNSEKQESLKTPEKKLRPQTLIESKKKLLELDFSESSSEEGQNSECSQKRQQNKGMVEQKKEKREQVKKAIIRRKQVKKDDQKKQNSQEQESQEQESQESEEEKAKEKAKQVVMADFVFDKEPQYQVLDQIRPQERVRGLISRCRSGLNLIWPEYEIKIESNKQEILYVKKQTIFFKNVYKIYSRTMTGHYRYFGKLETNMTGTQYQVFISENGVHENLKAEIYFPNDTRSNQPRYFIMLSLIHGFNLSDLVVTDTNHVTLKELYKNQQNKSKMMILHTRKPVFNQQIRGFVLNFAGRVSMPSIKNFILEDVNTQKEVLMFGKIDKDNFRLQISSPLNCVIGTAVALIQFEGRFME